MLWTVVVLLLVLWLLGFTMHVAGGLIHILLVVALVVIVLRLLTGSSFPVMRRIASCKYCTAKNTGLCGSDE